MRLCDWLLSLCPERSLHKFPRNTNWLLTVVAWSFWFLKAMVSLSLFLAPSFFSLSFFLPFFIPFLWLNVFCKWINNSLNQFSILLCCIVKLKESVSLVRQKIAFRDRGFDSRGLSMNGKCITSTWRKNSHIYWLTQIPDGLSLHTDHHEESPGSPWNCKDQSAAHNLGNAFSKTAQ